MLQISDLIAREAIRDLVIRYNSYGDSALFDRMLGLFTPDATLEIDGQSYQGLGELRRVFSSVSDQTSHAHGPPRFLRHCTATHQIDLVDESTATGRCYFFVLTPSGLDHWGRYLDDYRVLDDEWRFTRRQVLVDALSPRSIFA